MPINFILYNFKKCPITRIYKDAIHQAEQREYFNNIYFFDDPHKSSTFLLQQISIMARIYDEKASQRPTLTFQYPTMYITKTHHIFLNRLRRKRKLCIIQSASSPTITISLQTPENREVQSLSKSTQSHQFHKYLTEISVESSSFELSQYIFRLSSKIQIEKSLSAQDIFKETSYEGSEKCGHSIHFINMDQQDIKKLIYNCSQKLLKSQGMNTEDVGIYYGERMKNKNSVGKSEGNRNRIEVRKQSGKKSRKQAVRQKARKLLQKIQNDSSFQFSNPKFKKQ